MVLVCIGSKDNCCDIGDDEWPVERSAQEEVQGETLSAESGDRHPTRLCLLSGLATNCFGMMESMKAEFTSKRLAVIRSDT